MIVVCAVIAVCVLIWSFASFVEYLCDLWADAKKPQTPRTDAFLQATTPCLRLADEGAKHDPHDHGDENVVAEGLGQSRPMDPGPVTWIALPADHELWCDAVAAKP